jgi:tRNA-binding protein
MATIEDLKRLDIRVGKIVEAKDFEEAEKPLLKLKIDFGPEIGTKNSAAGLIPTYKAEELVGKLVLGVVNFPPRRIADFVSEVLTLGVPNKDGGWMLVIPEFPQKTMIGKKMA